MSILGLRQQPAESDRSLLQLALELCRNIVILLTNSLFQQLCVVLIYLTAEEMCFRLQELLRLPAIVHVIRQQAGPLLEASRHLVDLDISLLLFGNWFPAGPCHFIRFTGRPILLRYSLDVGGNPRLRRHFADRYRLAH